MHQRKIILLNKHPFGKIFATQSTKGQQPYCAKSSHKLPINRPTTQLKTGDRVQVGLFQGRSSKWATNMKRCSNELIGKCNERYHFTSTQSKKKKLKQLKAILKLNVCIFLYSVIPLLAFYPTEKHPDLRKNAQGC